MNESYARRKRINAARGRVLECNEEPLIADLRDAGYPVGSAWDLFNRAEPWRVDEPIPNYDSAIPILANHLSRPYHIAVKEGIVRAMTCSASLPYFDQLVSEFERTTDEAAADRAAATELLAPAMDGLMSRSDLDELVFVHWTNYRSVLAYAIASLASKQQIPLVIGLIEDKRHDSDSRKSLARVLLPRLGRWRMKDSKAAEVCRDLIG